MSLKSKIGGQHATPKLLRAALRTQVRLRNKVRKAAAVTQRALRPRPPSSTKPPVSSASLPPAARLNVEIEMARRAIRDKVNALRRGETERERLLDLYIKEPLQHVLKKTPFRQKALPSRDETALSFPTRESPLVDAFLAGEDLALTSELPHGPTGTSTLQRDLTASSPPLLSPPSLSAGPEEVFGDDDDTAAVGETTRYLQRRPIGDDALYRHYLSRMVAQETDPWFGPRFVYQHGETHPQLYMGNIPLHLDVDTLTVAGRVYPVTEGLLELLFEKRPRSTAISTEDRRAYKAILHASNVLRLRYQGSQALRGRNTAKYRDFIAPLLRARQHTGSGLRFGSRPTFTYWRDPNALVRRLRVLHASRAAGHDAHDGEIHEIEQELRAARILR